MSRIYKDLHDPRRKLAFLDRMALGPNMQSPGDIISRMLCDLVEPVRLPSDFRQLDDLTVWRARHGHSEICLPLCDFTYTATYSLRFNEPRLVELKRDGDRGGLEWVEFDPSLSKGFSSALDSMVKADRRSADIEMTRGRIDSYWPDFSISSSLATFELFFHSCLSFDLNTFSMNAHLTRTKES